MFLAHSGRVRESLVMGAGPLRGLQFFCLRNLAFCSVMSRKILKVGGLRETLLGVNKLYLSYLCTRQRVEFFNNLESTRISKITCQCIVGGDFNCQLDCKKIQDRSPVLLKNLLQRNDLIDTWRAINPTDLGFTRYEKSSQTSNRIDYVFYVF